MGKKIFSMLICLVIVVGGIPLMSTEKSQLTAKAESTVNLTIEPGKTIDYVNQSASEDSVSISKLKENQSGSINTTSSVGKIEFEETAASRKFLVAYTPINVSTLVPAHTSYTLSFSVNFFLGRSSSGTARAFSEFFDLDEMIKNNKSPDDLLLNCGANTNSSSTSSGEILASTESLKRNYTNVDDIKDENLSITATFVNDTNEEKVISHNYGFMAGIGYASSKTHVLNANIQFLPSEAPVANIVNAVTSHDMSVECGQDNPIDFNMLESIDGNLAPGNYYLNNDIELTQALEISGGVVNLCLHGHKLNYVGSDERAAVVLGGDATLNICDCSADTVHSEPVTIYDASGKLKGSDIKGGIITGGKASGVFIYGNMNMYGGTVCGNIFDGIGGGGIEVNSGYFNMYGGSIKGNLSYTAGGVYINSGQAIIRGGSITNNTSVGQLGGGVVSYGRSVGVSGDVLIIDNTSYATVNNDNTVSGGITNNINLAYTNLYIAEPGLNENALIGVNYFQGDSIDSMTESVGYALSLNAYDLNNIEGEVKASLSNFTYDGKERILIQDADELYIAYKIIKNETTNGSFKITNDLGNEITGAIYGKKVKIVPTAASKYKLDKITVTDSNGTNVTVGSDNAFTMPDKNVTVQVTFRQLIYNITVTWSNTSIKYNSEYIGNWNPKTHQYENAQVEGWSANPTCKLSNIGESSVTVTSSYKQIDSNITGTFSYPAKNQPLAVNRYMLQTLRLSGKPSDTSGQLKDILSITITIT